ncbi:hypothetical protein K443DRAFT_97791 [Laccaria amethystina LaAM-08-1]|uniref:HTH CENPB-type domain-containing protein n=1 Tax=Laccaria amethystina LaAM-08-1 TaxID=1095629 RepID=A0A0C9XKF7_9AGAR|nr:hypothetical protein K443DRAFT_97791 [Laccaria amethystina LaAM-08-1]
MVGRALSERVKLQERRHVDNTIMQHAIDEYLREQEKPDGVRKRGCRPIADKYGVSSSTSQALLTHAEEQVLVDWILESSDRALPPSLANIAVHANGILGGREVLVEPVGESWASCYGKGSFTQ